MSWTEYLEATRPRPLNPFHDVVAPFLPVPAGHALDLGAGQGKTTRWLLDQGWSVDAVEADPDMLAAFRGFVPESDRVRLFQVPYDQAELAESDLVLGVFSLFFQPPDRFEPLWARVKASLRPGGVFGGQLLGPRDDWATGGRAITGYPPGALATHDRADVERLLTGWEVLHWDEVEREGTVATGEPKFWHVHHVVARRPFTD